MKSTELAGESPNITERIVEDDADSNEASAPISAEDKAKLARRKRMLTILHLLDRLSKGARLLARSLQDPTPEKGSTNGKLNKMLQKIGKLLQALQSIPQESPQDQEWAIAVSSSTPNVIVYGDSTEFLKWRRALEKLRNRYRMFLV